MLPILAFTLIAAPAESKLLAGPAPVTNPLKGFAPYVDEAPKVEDVPFTMGYRYATWRELEPKEGEYAFEAWEAKNLRAGLAANRRMVVRVQMDYPSQPTGVPQWLIDKGLKMNPYTEHGGGKSPDYGDPRLRTALQKLIAEMGKRWNRNPQIAYVQMGLLGFWGEWHTWPYDNLFAPPEVQKEVVDGMLAAFPDKHVLGRTATGPLGQHARMGYHDDMIPQDTLGPEEWQFLPNLRLAGRGDNWKVAPIGGEMVPFAAVQYLGKDWDQTLRAVREAHLSWIGPYCPLLENPGDPTYRSRVEELSRMLGYTFRLDRVQHTPGGSGVTVKLSGTNTGVAPFYGRWPVRFALLDGKGAVAAKADSSADPRTWIPGPFSASANLARPAKKGTYRLAIGMIDPWTGQSAVRFANRAPVVDGWTVLASLSL